MASKTDFLDLLKKDPVADKDDTFNIETMLNENWDKIDAFLAGMEEFKQLLQLHAGRHGKNGADPLTPEDIDAAKATHNHDGAYAPKAHNHSATDVGAAPAGHTHTPASIGAAPASHGNHVPDVQAADAATFLRNDNTWQKVTPAGIGLGNVPNVSTNNQTPSYSVASTLANLVSKETLSTAFGKIAKAIQALITHLANRDNPHGVTAAQVGASPDGHTHTPASLGAAASDHKHAAGDITGILDAGRGGTGVTSIDTLISNFGLGKVETGNYSGTGVTTKTLSFSFEPKLVIIGCKTTTIGARIVGATALTAVRGCGEAVVVLSGDYVEHCKCSFVEKSVILSLEGMGSAYGAHDVCNYSNISYYYIAIG